MPPLKREFTDQERNLWTLAWIATAVASLAALAAVALYLGLELPPEEMRSYYTSTTGYAPPPGKGVAPPGSIPRGALVGLNAPGPQVDPNASGQVTRPGGLATGVAPRPGRREDPAPDGAPGRQPRGAGGHAEVPEEARRMRNPLARDRSAVELGGRGYAVHCAMCHGEIGGTIGPVGERYTPRPPDLREHAPGHPDGYLYYTITAGIRSTPTPEAAQYLPREWHSFRGRLSARERWAIVSYLKAAAPTP